MVGASVKKAYVFSMTMPANAERVLVVDDDDSVRSALARFLQKAGYETVQANSGTAALDLLQRARFAAMLCDIRMPGMTGVDLLPRVVESDPDIAVIMLTAVGDPGSAIQCLKLGAIDYLIKPVELEELAHALRYGLRKRTLEIERRGMEQWLQEQVAEKTRELNEQARQVELLSLSILMALVDESEEPGEGQRNHSQRVANMSAHVAVEMGLDAEGTEMVRLAGRLHDLGKVALRNERLQRVTNPEAHQESIETDAAKVAARILYPLRRYHDMAVFIAHQHEHWDGSGVPDKLAGEKIPVGSRVIAVVNGYDELAEGAPGSPGIPPLEAYERVKAAEGTLYDPRAVAGLSVVLGRRRSIGIKPPA